MGDQAKVGVRGWRATTAVFLVGFVIFIRASSSTAVTFAVLGLGVGLVGLLGTTIAAIDARRSADALSGDVAGITEATERLEAVLAQVDTASRTLAVATRRAQIEHLRVALAPPWTAFRGEDRLTRAPVTRMEVLPLASSYNQALRPIRTLSPVLDHLGDTFVLAVADSPGNQAVHRGMLFELVAAIEAAWTTLEAPPAAMLEAVANPGRS